MSRELEIVFLLRRQRIEAQVLTVPVQAQVFIASSPMAATTLRAQRQQFLRSREQGLHLAAGGQLAQ